MPSITFDKAQKALGHLNKKRHPNGIQETPDLLKVKGWEKSRIIYELKTDIEKAFSAEIERFRDLSDEVNELQQEQREIDKKDKKSDSDKKRLEEIDKKITEAENESKDIFKQEREVRLSHKLTEEKFKNHITGDAFIDLDFAIEMNGEQKEEPKAGSE